MFIKNLSLSDVVVSALVKGKVVNEQATVEISVGSDDSLTLQEFLDAVPQGSVTFDIESITPVEVFCHKGSVALVKTGANSFWVTGA